MTAQQKQLINGSLKWLLTIAFISGGIALMVKANGISIKDHARRIQQNEMCNSIIETKIDRMASDIQDIARKQDKINDAIRDYLKERRDR